MISILLQMLRLFPFFCGGHRQLAVENLEGEDRAGGALLTTRRRRPTIRHLRDDEHAGKPPGRAGPRSRREPPAPGARSLPLRALDVGVGRRPGWHAVREAV